ncbi:hypothetical protein M427DRAFT_57737 [Gonapodya prolifera JEL478]|uniref:Uncharacterized protein n=1 Tax=Gonapodya prolifera (strain JEL478) TaxID=1344416 RepID=A0A139ACU0_GONPJ|nr:hypothetical protein M427DRAFT_57737 [Gonapodya prolifera JEL478]|eukprot:KXS14265.1 hypothetical protein M427DRAFT_57737 [Gonapodya prolifera JEL478]
MHKPKDWSFFINFALAVNASEPHQGKRHDPKARPGPPSRKPTTTFPPPIGNTDSSPSLANK